MAILTNSASPKASPDGLLILRLPPRLTARLPLLLPRRNSALPAGEFKGSGEHLSLADSDDWNFGTGDFTIDCWIRLNAIGMSEMDFYSAQIQM